MRDPTPKTPPLSHDGQRRREQILRLAQQAAVHRGRQRQVRRAAALVLLVATAIGVGVRLRHVTPIREVKNDPRPIPVPAIPKRSATPDRVGPPVVAVTPAHRGRPEVVITRIQTDAGLTDRLSVHRDPAGWQRLSDDDLLRRLSDAGKPAGLAYVDGRAMLLFRGDPRNGARVSSHLASHWRPHAHE